MAPKQNIAYSQKNVLHKQSLLHQQLRWPQLQHQQTPPASSSPLSAASAASTDLAPADSNVKVQELAAAKAGLSLAEWQHMREEQDKYHSELEFDDDFDAEEFSPTKPPADLNTVPYTARLARSASSPILPAKPVRGDLGEVKGQWQRIYNQENGLRHLAEAVMKEEIDARLTGKIAPSAEDLKWTAETMHEILLSTDRVLLESVMLGNLSYEKRHDPNLRTILDNNWEQAKFQPSIYHQSLVDHNGISPSAEELVDALDIMEAYVKGCSAQDTTDLACTPLDARHAHAIDTWMHPRTKGDLQKRTKQQNHCDVHAAQTKAFIAALRERIDNIEDKTKPLEFPLVEIGYSNRSILHLKSHKAHTGPNYIMNLMEAIFNNKESAFQKSYVVEQEVIYLIWSVEQAEISEVSWTKLAEGYIYNGGGFSHYPAGLSNNSAQKTRSSERSAAQDYMMRNSVYVLNWEEIKRCREHDAMLLEEEASQLEEKYTLEQSERTTRALDTLRMRLDSEHTPGAPTVDFVEDFEGKLEEMTRKLRIDDDHIAVAEKAARSTLDVVQQLPQSFHQLELYCEAAGLDAENEGEDEEDQDTGTGSKGEVEGEEGHEGDDDGENVVAMSRQRVADILSQRHRQRPSL